MTVPLHGTFVSHKYMDVYGGCTYFSYIYTLEDDFVSKICLEI